MDERPLTALAAFGITCPAARLESLGGAGGFSGARFWKVHDAGGPLCLRRWPKEHPSAERLHFIHAVLRHVSGAGFALVPCPRLARSGESFVQESGYLWELTPWMPGAADYRQEPSAERLAAALTALAEFHQAAATFPVSGDRGPSPGIAVRRRLLAEWRAGQAERLGAAVRPGRWPELAERAVKVLGHFRALSGAVAEELDRAAGLEVPLTVCMRDVWHDHVLFVGAKIGGLVDFGSMDVDNPATDVARLLGSLVGDDPEQWRIGLAAFEQVRPLGGPERILLRCFDRSTVLMAGLNWLKWVYSDQREFDDPRAVVRRIDEILVRLEHAAKSPAAQDSVADGKLG